MKKILAITVLTFAAFCSNAQQIKQDSIIPQIQHPEYLIKSGELMQGAVRNVTYAVGSYTLSSIFFAVGIASSSTSTTNTQPSSPHPFVNGFAVSFAAIGVYNSFMFYKRINQSGAYLKASVTGFGVGISLK
jgi:hypothetical protein